MINSRKELGDAHYTDEQVEILNDHLAQETMIAVMKKTDVQFLVQHVQDLIRETMKPLYFEINDRYTRAEAKAIMNELMFGLLAQDHVYEYEVVCDETINTPMNVDRGDLILDVYFKTKLFKDPICVRGTGMTVILAAKDPDKDVSSQQKQSNNSNPVYGANSANGGYATITSGHLTASGQSSSSHYSFAGAPSIPLALFVQNQTAELPAMVWELKDDAGQLCKMELKPEGTISAHEALLLTMMMQASASSPLAFSPYMYVKKHNLERHFKFSS